MKRAKVRQLVMDVLAARDAIPDRPLTVDSLTIDFDARQVLFRGRVIDCETRSVVIPVVTTDRLVVTPGMRGTVI